MRRAAAACALVLAALTASAASARRDPTLDVEDRYRHALADFAAGELAKAVNRMAVLERKIANGCLEAVEARTAEALAHRDPESLVIQAFLRLVVRQARYQSRQPAGGLFPFESVSIRAVERLVEMYLATSTDDEAPSLGAGLLAYLAHGIGALRSAPRLQTARELLQAALELDPNHHAARYQLVVVLELLGRPGQALQHLDPLLELAPDDAQLRVRRATLNLKAGRVDLGRELLEELAAAGPIWARELATQKLARLLAREGRPDEAAELLRRAMQELPPEKLSLQLAALLDPEWTESWRVVGTWVARASGDAGPSARWIYEDGARRKIDALRTEIGMAVGRRSERLERALIALPDLDDPYREVLKVCWQ